MSKLTNISSPWIQITLLLTMISLSSLSSATTRRKYDNNGVSYSDHCNSTTPKSTAQQEHEQFLDDNFLLLPRHVSGGTPFLNHTSSKTTAVFRHFKAYKTITGNVSKVEVTLILRQKLHDDFYYGFRNYSYDSKYARSRFFSRRSPKGVLWFRLSGYMYEDTGVICMVGHGNGFSREGDTIDDLPVVLKVSNFKKKSSINTSLITATLESLSSVGDSSYFEKISLLMFNEMGYEYSLVLQESDNGGFEGINYVLKSLPLPSEPVDTFCSIFSSFYQFELAYPISCDSEKNCSPFGSNIGYLPRGLMFTSTECDNEDRKLRVLVRFSERSYDDDYSASFDPKTTLIGEGVWDGNQNQLQIVACKILNFTESSPNAHVGDCSVMLTLRFSATRSIRDDSRIRGEIISSKPASDSKYFDTILLKSSQMQGYGVDGLRYKYTQIDKVSKLCTPPKKGNHVKKKNDRYSNGLYDMNFDVTVKSADGNSSLGHLIPVYVGDRAYDQQGEFAMYAATTSSDVNVINSTLQVPMNISYRISFSEPSALNHPKYIEISAEGIFDPETGSLCMIGCKKVGSKGQPTIKVDLDCEIAINFQLQSLNLENSGVYIKGYIESTRKRKDPLYFEELELTSSAYIGFIASENMLSMDFETILDLTSDVLSCLFAAFQLFYVEKHARRLSFVYLIMFGILSLSYMIPLLLNIESLFLADHYSQNDVLVPIFAMTTFLLQFRLVQLIWSSRGNEELNLGAPEKKGPLYFTLRIYIVGALVTCVLNWQKLTRD